MIPPSRKKKKREKRNYFRYIIYIKCKIMSPTRIQQQPLINSSQLFSRRLYIMSSAARTTVLYPFFLIYFLNVFFVSCFEWCMQIAFNNIFRLLPFPEFPSIIAHLYSHALINNLTRKTDFFKRDFLF